MLQEARDELQGGQRDSADLLATAVAITEGHLSVLDLFQATVGDGDAEDVAAQVVVVLPCAFLESDMIYLNQ